MRVLLLTLLFACTDDPKLPTCKSLGCDGTQNVPLYCPTEGEHAGECFCAAPTKEDQWCRP